MIVITLTNCPPALRGDLTAWLQEIDVGVFIGRVSGRVRDELWERVCRHAKSGRATMVFSVRSEQGFDFRVHHANWEPIDFDGLKLMLHPSLRRVQDRKNDSGLPEGFSRAARMNKARQFTGRRTAPHSFPEHYAVIDLETTGLSPHQDLIIEMGALEVERGEIIRGVEVLVRVEGQIPPEIVSLTGISDGMLQELGCSEEDALAGFLGFVGSLPIVSHQVSFDLSFLRAACKRCGLAMPDNPCIDTHALSRRLVQDAKDWKLTTLAAHLGIQMEGSHRSMADCMTTRLLFEKLIEIADDAE